MRKKKVLLTAFGPYGPWQENASWKALIEFTRDLPDEMVVVTRRYPVDYDKVKQALTLDLAAGYDFAIHLGQAPSRAKLHLEAVALNLGTLGPGTSGLGTSGLGPTAKSAQNGAESFSGLGLATNDAQNAPGNAPAFFELQPDGPPAFISKLPLDFWAQGLCAMGIPSAVSLNAGAYLCNAAYYWSKYTCLDFGLPTESLFVHIPLNEQQAACCPEDHAFLKTEDAARAIRWLLHAMASLPSAIHA